jgi:hypothetical protein
MGTLKSFWGWKDEKNDNGSGAEDSCFLLLIPSFSFQILIIPMFWLFERKSNKTFQGCKTEPIGIVFFVIGVSLLSICKKVSKMMHLLMQLFFPCEIIFFTSNENSRKID